MPSTQGTAFFFHVHPRIFLHVLFSFIPIITYWILSLKIDVAYCWNVSVSEYSLRMESCEKNFEETPKKSSKSLMTLVSSKTWNCSCSVFHAPPKCSRYYSLQLAIVICLCSSLLFVYIPCNLATTCILSAMCGLPCDCTHYSHDYYYPSV